MRNRASLIERQLPCGGSTASAIAAAAENRAVGPVLPVREDPAALLPAGGLLTGTTIAVDGSTAFLLALLATATTRDSWAAVFGMRGLGLLAASEIGVALNRLALVPDPGTELATVVAALLDGVDLVVIAAVGFVRDGTKGRAMARRLAARARNRGAVLIPFGADGLWPAAELRLSATDRCWTGIDNGHGYLTGHDTTVTVRGRGSAARSFQVSLTLQADAPEPCEPNRCQPRRRSRQTLNPGSDGEGSASDTAAFHRLTSRRSCRRGPADLCQLSSSIS